MWKIASILALLIVAVLAGWFFLGDEAAYQEVGAPGAERAEEVVVPSLPVDSDEPALAAAQEQAGGVEPVPLPEAPEWILPPLNQSDAFVRERLGEIGVPAGWIAEEELVRRFATVLDSGSRGDYPRRQLGVLALGAPFGVLEQDGRLIADPANQARYAGLFAALDAIDPRRAARLLRFLSPRINEALAELSSSADAEALLTAGLRQVLAVPVLTEPPELVRPNVFYTYADPELEQLKPLQKLLLRSGPENVLRIQAWVREFAAAFGINSAGAVP